MDEVSETARKYAQSGQPEQGKRYTYADYAGWDDGNRYELIDGQVYLMSAPSVMHQRILGRLLRQLADFLDGKPCEVLIAPLDVCINGLGDGDDTVVHPDLLVICDHEKLDKKRCNGAPDMVIEITSPSTSRLDRIKKLNKYFQAGVREYWVVDPDDRSVSAHVLENGKYVISAYDDEDTAPVSLLEGCTIALPDVFGE